ncbi:MAG: class I SAM-dependent methyltransferase [Defluviitaleaceae bacterium]|nr:class I SAM-dependent methyltransferase [Defluviitaleaceae bacterium]
MNEAKFEGMGGIYAKYRPTYAAGFIEYLRTSVGVNDAVTVADVGSGTGIFTRQLLNIGSKVLAVEPNGDMRTVAEKELSSYKNFISINGTAEATALAAVSVDFITVAQAYHWFDQIKFKAECGRIIKPGGKVVLVWNIRDYSDISVIECDRINKKYCPNFKGFGGGIGRESDFNGFFIGAYEHKIFKNDLVFDLDGFIGRSLSASYALKENDENYGTYISELTGYFNKYAVGGYLAVLNYTESYVGVV